MDDLDFTPFHEPLDDRALDQLFRRARTHNKFLDREVPDELLRRVVDLMKLGPTSANQSPARILFLKSRAAKERLAPHMSEGNRAKTLAAPVNAIVGYDLEFYEKLPKLYPFTDARSWFVGKPDAIATSALRNGSLQVAYLILAARALGLSCGPQTGFDNDGVDRAFFPDGIVKSNVIVNLGYGDKAGLRPRAPRFFFEEMARIL